jgi:hypothetical protein
MKKIVPAACLLLIATFGFAQTTTKKTYELNDFLKQFYDLTTLPSYETGTYAAQESSYDRTGMNNDGFGGQYSFVRRNPDSSLVLIDIKGPGVVNRIWTPTPTDDTLDFYIDNNNTPAFSIKYRELFTGKHFPFVAPLCANQLGGFYCYLPIPFNSSFKMVLRGKKAYFHQIGYRIYPAGTTMKPFKLPLAKEEIAALEKIAAIWNNDQKTLNDLQGAQSAIRPSMKSVTLKPWEPVTVYQTNLPGRIAGFEIISDAPLEKIARNIDLKITWDNEKQPAVFCPLADYFGYAFGKASMRGLLAGSDGRKHYSYFPMPYDESAKIELLYRRPVANEGPNSITLNTKVYMVWRKRNEQSEGKFYAQWQRSNPVPAGKPFTMLDIKGQGHFAGAVLQSQGLGTGITSFFEGDDSTVIDGELRFHGTGSEDFFNGGWYALLDCWDAAMSLPLSGSLDYSIPLCRTGGYRFFITDKMSFSKSLFQSIEHGPEYNNVPSDYSSVSYYYSSSPNNQAIVPGTENTKIYMPDTLEIYPQLMHTAMDNFINVEAKWAFSIPAKTMYYTIRENSIIQMYLRDIPPGSYKMFLDYSKGPDAAQFSISQRQSQLSEWIDANSNEQERIPMQQLAEIKVTDLSNSFSFRFKTPGNRNKFTLSRIILVKKPAGK